MLVQLFGASLSTSCVNSALRQVATKFGHPYNSIFSIINQNFYVDDYLISLSTVAEAISVCHSLTEIFQRRGFLLIEWTPKFYSPFLPQNDLPKLSNTF